MYVHRDFQFLQFRQRIQNLLQYLSVDRLIGIHNQDYDVGTGSVSVPTTASCLNTEVYRIHS